MPVFLSPAWLRELDAAVRAAPALSELGPLEIEQVVSGVPHQGEVRYRIVVDGGGARVTDDDGHERSADVRLTTDYTTAVAIAAGKENAQTALADGRLRLGGKVDVLVRRAPAFAVLGDATAALRGVTTFPPP
jgi:SCP-2 sterol transfer family